MGIALRRAEEWDLGIRYVSNTGSGVGSMKYE